MKMICIMCLEHCSKQVRKVFKDLEVSVVSELEVKGFSSEKRSQARWWPGDHELPTYSSLCFAIVTQDKATEIMDQIEEMTKADEEGHPMRAFLLDVERMI